MKAPFWYVVKRSGAYVAASSVGTGRPVRRQRKARVWTCRAPAKRYAALVRGRVVRVWARLPKPRLPQWVDPTPLDAGEVEAWRRGETCWQRYVVRVGPVVSIRRAEDHMPEGVTHYTNVDAAPPDVWVEAGLRAAAMLRKADR